MSTRGFPRDIRLVDLECANTPRSLVPAGTLDISWSVPGSSLVHFPCLAGTNHSWVFYRGRCSQLISVAALRLGGIRNGLQKP